MPTTVNRIVRALDRNDFDQVRRIVDASRRTLPSRLFAPERTIADREIPVNVENIKTDRGNGRVSQGLIFLELVSNIFKGKNVESVLKFDKVPVYVNPKNF